MKIKQSHGPSFKSRIVLRGDWVDAEKRALSSALPVMLDTAKKYGVDVHCIKETFVRENNEFVVNHSVLVTKEAKSILGLIAKFLTGETQYKRLGITRSSQFNGNASSAIWRGIEHISRKVFGENPIRVANSTFYSKNANEWKSFSQFFEDRTAFLAKDLRENIDSTDMANTQIKSASRGILA